MNGICVHCHQGEPRIVCAEDGPANRMFIHIANLKVLVETAGPSFLDSHQYCLLSFFGPSYRGKRYILCLLWLFLFPEEAFTILRCNQKNHRARVCSLFCGRTS